MANWLQKNLLPMLGNQNSHNLPVKTAPNAVSIASPAKQSESLSSASLIYGMAASALFVVAVYFLLTGVWFTGFLVLLPAICFLGFSLYYLKPR